MGRHAPGATERHAFADAGCSLHQFADRFQTSYSSAQNWMARYGYEPVKIRQETDAHPITIEHAYYALLASVVMGWPSKESLRKIAN